MIKLILMRLKLYSLYKSDYKIVRKCGISTTYHLEKIKKLEEEIFIKERRFFYKQTCFVFCPRCGEELTHSESFVKDTDYVYYDCSRCSFESAWDFDHPAPIRVM